ncbi:unnamed protein product [Adineta ricciae]|uniref:Uncharacterized protein n=1 Tax=Adineta ricciae TaxID=249248 RepID=A0A815C281_ADIRI|nr:unnamed protein product [Adineta ricciae]CAF1608331.1 unnamed protein product [Adineta ricciae]
MVLLINIVVFLLLPLYSFEYFLWRNIPRSIEENIKHRLITDLRQCSENSFTSFHIGFPINHQLIIHTIILPNYIKSYRILRQDLVEKLLNFNVNNPIDLDVLRSAISSLTSTFLQIIPPLKPPVNTDQSIIASIEKCLTDLRDYLAILQNKLATSFENSKTINTDLWEHSQLFEKTKESHSKCWFSCKKLRETMEQQSAHLFTLQLNAANADKEMKEWKELVWNVDHLIIRHQQNLHLIKDRFQKQTLFENFFVNFQSMFDSLNATSDNLIDQLFNMKPIIKQMNIFYVVLRQNYSIIPFLEPLILNKDLQRLNEKITEMKLYLEHLQTTITSTIKDQSNSEEKDDDYNPFVPEDTSIDTTTIQLTKEQETDTNYSSHETSTIIQGKTNDDQEIPPQNTTTSTQDTFFDGQGSASYDTSLETSTMVKDESGSTITVRISTINDDEYDDKNSFVLDDTSIDTTTTRLSTENEIDSSNSSLTTSILISNEYNDGDQQIILPDTTTVIQDEYDSGVPVTILPTNENEHDNDRLFIPEDTFIDTTTIQLTTKEEELDSNYLFPETSTIVQDKSDSTMTVTIPPTETFIYDEELTTPDIKHDQYRVIERCEVMTISKDENSTKLNCTWVLVPTDEHESISTTSILMTTDIVTESKLDIINNETIVSTTVVPEVKNSTSSESLRGYQFMMCWPQNLIKLTNDSEETNSSRCEVITTSYDENNFDENITTTILPEHSSSTEIIKINSEENKEEEYKDYPIDESTTVEIETTSSTFRPFDRKYLFNIIRPETFMVVQNEANSQKKDANEYNIFSKTIDKNQDE